MTWSIVFLIVALILFILASVNVPSARVSLGWAGLAFLSLYFLFAGGMLPLR